MSISSIKRRFTENQLPPPGNKDLWLLLSVDLQLFLGFFVMFVIGWIAEPEAFQIGYDAVNGPVAFANTVILLTSSYFAVLMSQRFEAGDEAGALKLIKVVIALGCAFIVLKLIGYVADWQAGHMAFDNAFFGYYLMITVTHLFHVVVGVGLFIAALVKVPEWMKLEKGREYVESVTVFWHFVDMVWVLLFPLCYLMG